MELKKYMRGGLDVSDAAIDSLWTPYADAQATVEALQAIIKQMGEQAARLAKDGMAAKAQVEALTKERDKAVTRCAHLDVLLRDEYLPKLDVEAVKRSIADRDHRIDEMEREIEQLDDTVEALQRDAWKEVFERSCDDTAHLKAALTARSQPAKPAGKMHACDIPGCVSCGNPEDATTPARWTAEEIEQAKREAKELGKAIGWLDSTAKGDDGE